MIIMKGIITSITSSGSYMPAPGIPPFAPSLPEIMFTAQSIPLLPLWMTNKNVKGIVGHPLVKNANINFVPGVTFLLDELYLLYRAQSLLCLRQPPFDDDDDGDDDDDDGGDDDYHYLIDTDLGR